MNRIAARITKKVINSVQEFTEIAEELPQKLQDEWSSFKEEVLAESERIEKKTTSSQDSINKPSTKKDLMQVQIDNLRSKVIEINKSIEERN